MTRVTFGGRLVDHSRQIEQAQRALFRLFAHAEAVGATIVMDEIVATPEQATELVKRWRAENPEIVQFWSLETPPTA